MVQLTGADAILVGLGVALIGVFMLAFGRRMERWQESFWRRVSPGDGGYLHYVGARIARYFVAFVAIVIGVAGVVSGCLDLAG